MLSKHELKTINAALNAELTLAAECMDILRLQRDALAERAQQLEQQLQACMAEKPQRASKKMVPPQSPSVSD